MKIKFLSRLNQNGQEQEIKFTAPVEVGEFEGMEVYVFEDPKNSTLNRIEVGENKLNIFAGPASINLDTSKEIEVEYKTPMGPITLVTKTELIEKKDNVTNIKYELLKDDEPIGKYHITLEIKK